MIVAYTIGYFLGWLLISVLPVYLLWNWLMPGLFGIPEITFWQSFGVVILCTFLFKSFNTSDKKD